MLREAVEVWGGEALNERTQRTVLLSLPLYAEGERGPERADGSPRVTQLS